MPPSLPVLLLGRLVQLLDILLKVTPLRPLPPSGLPSAAVVAARRVSR